MFNLLSNDAHFQCWYRYIRKVLVLLHSAKDSSFMDIKRSPLLDDNKKYYNYRTIC